MRVLHVLGRLTRGGAETWLMHVLRHIDRQRLRMDFLVHTAQPAAYDEEARALGSRVLPCQQPSRPRLYARNLHRIIREHGPYDVVHSHVHHYSGYVLRLAREAGVPIRIAHSHSDTTRVEASAGCARRVYTGLMARWLSRYATLGLAASSGAAAALFGPDWQSDPRWRILYCAVDLDPFAAPVSREEVRADLGIPQDSFVLGHVGSFTPAKNHSFLIQIAAEVARRNASARLLLVGGGPLQPEVERWVQEAGLEGRAVFAGMRADVPRLMRGAIDVLALPSLREGLPLVGIEAQAAGIPLLLCDNVTTEVDVVPSLVRRLSLEEPAAAWAEAALAAPRASVPAGQALSALRASPFDIRRCVAQLESVYTGGE